MSRYNVVSTNTSKQERILQIAQLRAAANSTFVSSEGE